MIQSPNPKRTVQWERVRENAGVHIFINTYFVWTQHFAHCLLCGLRVLVQTQDLAQSMLHAKLLEYLFEAVKSDLLVGGEASSIHAVRSCGLRRELFNQLDDHSLPWQDPDSPYPCKHRVSEGIDGMQEEPRSGTSQTPERALHRPRRQLNPVCQEGRRRVIEARCSIPACYVAFSSRKCDVTTANVSPAYCRRSAC